MTERNLIYCDFTSHFTNKISARRERKKQPSQPIPTDLWPPVAIPLVILCLPKRAKSNTHKSLPNT